MEKHISQGNEPLKEDAQETDGLWVSDEPYEDMEIMGFIPGPIEPEDGLELPEQGDQDKLTDDEQLQYVMEMEERAGIAFNDLEEALEWERTHCGEYDMVPDEEYESELTEEDMQLMHDMSDIREEKLETAFNRLAQFELQAAPALTVKNGHQKQIISFRDGDKISVKTEVMDTKEKEELEDALKTIRAMERIDKDQVDEIEIRVFNRVRKAGVGDLEKDGFDLER